MYYVMIGDHTYHCVRFTGEEPFGVDEQRPEEVRRYRFDDESAWSDEKLKSELERVSGGKGYDPFAMVAIDYEQSRRRGEEIETYDDWNEMMESFNSFAREYGVDDDDDEDDYEPLRVFHAGDFTSDALALIKEIADSYRKVTQLFKVTRYPGFEHEIGQAFSKVETAKASFLRAFEGMSRSETEEDMLIEAGRILVQVYASEREIAEMYEQENESEDFLYAGMALLRDAETRRMM